SQPSAAGTARFQVHVIDSRSGKEYASLTWLGYSHPAVAFSPSGRLLAIRSSRGLEVYDLVRGVRRQLPVAGSHSPRVYFRDEWHLLADQPTGSMSIQPCTTRTWDLRTGHLLPYPDGHHGLVSALVFRSDGRTLFSASYDGKLRCWDTAST